MLPLEKPEMSTDQTILSIVLANLKMKKLPAMMPVQTSQSAAG
jgi:hypothetical protein